jgi:hypothetical protein
MPLVSLAEEGNVLHVYDFRVKPGCGDEFIVAFNEFDYSDDNLMHQSSAQVKDGVLCRDAADPDRFFLIGEWRSIEEHRAVLQAVSARSKPRFFSLLEGEKWIPPVYATVVSSTPAEYLAKVNKA